MTQQQLQFIMQQQLPGGGSGGGNPPVNFSVEPDPLPSPTPMFPEGNPRGLPNMNSGNLPGTSSPTFDRFPANPYPGPANETFDLPTLNEPSYFQEDPMPDFPNLPQFGTPDFSNPGVNVPPNDSMYVPPGQNYYFPADQPTDFSNLGYDQTAQGNPNYGDYFGQNSFDVPYGGADMSSVPSIFPEEGNYLPNEFDRFMYGDTGTADTGNSAPGVDDPSQPVSSPYPTTTPSLGANGVLGTSPDIWGTSPSTRAPLIYPNQGATNPNGTPIIDPRTGQPVGGTILSDADVARRRAMEQFPGDPRYSARSFLHPGQTALRAGSDLIAGASKIPGIVGQGAEALWNNILNDPRNTDPSYLRSIGYEPGQGTGSLFPGEVTGPSRGPLDTLTGGIEGQGGSFFHGELTQPNAIDPATGMPRTDTPPSAMNPGGYNYPTHGPTSVAGAGYQLGAGPSPINVQGTAFGNAMAIAHLRRLMAGKYTPINTYGEMRSDMSGYGAPSPMPFQQYRQGQVNIGDFLRANPQWINQNFGTHIAGQGPINPGPPVKGSRHTALNQPV